MQETANGTERRTDWNGVNWRQVNRRVRNLRQRIFRAAQAGDNKRVRSLQKLMLRSRANRLLSVRRVTQQNTGSQTAGVDKVLCKTPQARGLLIDQLTSLDVWRAQPVRRVYIPKPNGKLRPLGIPAIADRAAQAMVKNALEPSWEGRFEGSSYGFRPGRGCHDAYAKIFGLARPRGRKKWILDADIKGAFDHISHEFLLREIGAVSGRELIRQWLTAGYMEDGLWHATEAGTPQGGVISPLLANIALHGMEAALGVRHNCNGTIIGSRAVVRYADDFVVFCETKEDAMKAQAELQEWLKERGLALSEEKTRIVHITEGFDFLGFTVRQYAVKNTRTGYKLLIKPSKESVKRIREKLRQEWLRLRSQKPSVVCARLDPIIRGWANYFRVSVARKTFEKLDHWMYRRAYRYARRRHPHKSRKWLLARYWGRLHPTRQDTWVFGDKQSGQYMQKFGWTSIRRHIMVKGCASPDDAGLRAYWERRKARQAQTRLSNRRQWIARRQHNKCVECGESLFTGEAIAPALFESEELHLHHKLPRCEGGRETSDNLELRHLYCHQQAHARRREDKTCAELA